MIGDMIPTHKARRVDRIAAKWAKGLKGQIVSLCATQPPPSPLPPRPLREVERRAHRPDGVRARRADADLEDVEDAYEHEQGIPGQRRTSLAHASAGFQKNGDGLGDDSDLVSDIIEDAPATDGPFAPIAPAIAPDVRKAYVKPLPRTGQRMRRKFQALPFRRRPFRKAIPTADDRRRRQSL